MSPSLWGHVCSTPEGRFHPHNGPFVTPSRASLAFRERWCASMCDSSDPREREEILEDIEDDLVSRAFLHHCSDCFREGVEAAMIGIKASRALSEIDA